MSRIEHFLWLAVSGAAFLFGRAIDPIPASNRVPLEHSSSGSGLVLESSVDAQPVTVETTSPRPHWDTVLHEVDPRRREEAALAMVVGIAPEECGALIAQLDRLPRSMRRDELQHLIYERWAEFDGEGALASAHSRPGDEREKAVASVVRGWVAEDPGAAWAWIGDSAKATDSWDSIAINYYRTAIESLVGRGRGNVAAELIDGTPESGSPERLVPMLTGTWSQEDLVATTEWVESFPKEERRREDGIRAIANTMTLAGPDVALLWARSLDVGDMEYALGTIASRWIQIGDKDKDDVVAWVSELTPNPIYDDAFAAVGSVLAPSDPDQAFRFLTSQVDLKKRDRSLARELQMVSFLEPANAMVWAQSISEVDSRHRMMESVYRNWSRRDAAAARAYVENSAEIPPELKQRLLQGP